MVRRCAVVDIREREPPRKTGKCLLDAHDVVARVEMAYVVAFPCIGATSPDLDGCSGHECPTTNSASNTVAPCPRAWILTGFRSASTISGCWRSKALRTSTTVMAASTSAGGEPR